METYSHNPDGNCPLTVKFPSVFFDRVPAAIKKILVPYELKQIDLFFTSQLYDGGSNDQLKAHFWAVPQIGRIDQFNSDLFRRDLLLGVPVFVWVVRRGREVAL